MGAPQGGLGTLQLLVLQFQLDLMNAQLVNQMLGRQRRSGPAGQPRLGLGAPRGVGAVVVVRPGHQSISLAGSGRPNR